MSVQRLTDRQRLFAVAYAADPDAARAVRAAGYSPARAKQTAGRLLKNPAVIRFLEEALKESRAASEPRPNDSDPSGLVINQTTLPERILREDAAVAFADPRACFGPDGAPLPPSDLPSDIARAVASVECKETKAKDGPTRTWKYSFWSKEKALERLAKQLGLAGRDPEKGRRAVVNFVMDLSAEQSAASDSDDREGGHGR